MSTLDIIWATRSGGGRPRRYLDFMIDGVPLSSQLNVDSITPFGWLEPAEQEASIDRLLMKSPPDMPNGRNTLYVCGECGDVGCGAVTLVVEHEADVVTWKSFGFENNYENMVHTDEFQHIGPFTFDAHQYHDVFERVKPANQMGSDSATSRDKN